MSIYFSDINSFIPLLHRPTFMKSVQDGLHKSDEGFGVVLLLVCALAAKRCNDPRVLLEEEIRKNNCIQHGNVEGAGENHKTYHSAGWYWFEQVRMSRFGISFQPTTLYQMQAAYVSSLFFGSSCRSIVVDSNQANSFVYLGNGNGVAWRWIWYSSCADDGSTSQKILRHGADC